MFTENECITDYLICEDTYKLLDARTSQSLWSNGQLWMPHGSGHYCNVHKIPGLNIGQSLYQLLMLKKEQGGVGLRI